MISPFTSLSLMQCVAGADCGSFEVSLAEIRLWDTFRLEESIVTFSKVNVTRLFLPAVTAYWRMTYEIGNIGAEIYDYSVNGNIPYVLPANAHWEQAITRLEVCQHDQRMDYYSSSLACTNAFADDKV